MLTDTKNPRVLVSFTASFMLSPELGYISLPPQSILGTATVRSQNRLRTNQHGET